jgi:hypothetical protein
MIRSRDKTVSIGDRLKTLWVLCTIAHFKEQGKSVAPYYIEEEFGKDVLKTYMCYWDIAMDDGYIAKDGHSLTKKAMRVVANWQYIRDNILAI